MTEHAYRFMQPILISSQGGAMIDILLCVLISSLFCNGLKIATGENMLLHFVEVWLDRFFYPNRKEVDDWKNFASRGKEPTPQVAKIYYPILYCIRCMPSIYGTLITLLFLPFHVELLWQIPLVIFCAVPVSTILAM